jgi:hypothetical protein
MVSKLRVSVQQILDQAVASVKILPGDVAAEFPFTAHMIEDFPAFLANRPASAGRSVTMDDCQHLDTQNLRLMYSGMQLIHSLLHKRHAPLKIYRSVCKYPAAGILAKVLLPAAAKYADQATSLKLITAYLTEAHAGASLATFHTGTPFVPSDPANRDDILHLPEMLQDSLQMTEITNFHGYMQIRGILRGGVSRQIDNIGIV